MVAGMPLHPVPPRNVLAPKTHHLCKKKCLGAFSFKCAATNGDANRLPLLSKASSVECRTCALATSTDQDPAEGNFTVSLTWGPNMLMEKTLSHYETFDGYRVLMVDMYGQSYGQAGMTGVRAGVSATCCNPVEYQLTVSGSWPAGATHFMVVPFTKEFTMPLGRMIAFTDVSTGSVTKVTGKANLGFSSETDARKFVDHPNSRAVTAQGIAAAADGVDVAMISIQSLTVTTSRRLSEDSSFRRLSTVKVVAEYTITIPETYSGPTFTAAAINTDTLKSAINAEAAKQGMGVTVNAITVDPVTSTVVGTPTESSTGGAHHTTGSFFLALVVCFLAVAGLQ